jgi:hypothetical protein
MTGYGNNRLLSGARSLGRAHTRDAAFTMHLMKQEVGEYIGVDMLHAAVPCVSPAQQGGVRVAGEVFAVSDPALLDRLDALEEHPDWCVSANITPNFLFHHDYLVQVQTHPYRRDPGLNGPIPSRRNQPDRLSCD